MNYDLANRIAVVTGARQGIGAAIARTLLHCGASVIITGRQEQQLADSLSNLKLETGREATGFVGNVTNESDITRLLEKHPKIDILVNNAGGFLQPFNTLETSKESWENQLTVNLTGPFLLSRAVLPGMIEQHWGRIINIGSITAVAPALGNATAYVAAKAGLIGFTRQLALEVASFGITVNAINPGTIATEHLNDYLATPGAPDTNTLSTDIPVGRLGSPSEIAGIIPYMVSDMGAFMTGGIIDINGGARMA